MCECVCVLQVKEQKEEAERFQQKLKEMEDLKIESFLVQLFHINKVFYKYSSILHPQVQAVYRRQSDRIDEPQAGTKDILASNSKSINIQAQPRNVVPLFLSLIHI